MKIQGVLIGCLFFIASCETSPDKAVCGVIDPLEELEWLNDIKPGFDLRASAAGAQIIQYQYKGEYVSLVEDCYNCPDALAFVYNCQGEVICEFGGIDGRITCPDFEEQATDEIVLFSYVQE